MFYGSYEKKVSVVALAKLLQHGVNNNDTRLQVRKYRRACGHLDVGTCPHQVLAATLTLSQPGGQVMPTQYCSILVSTPSFEIHRRACNVDFLAENFASFGEPRFEQKNKLMHIMILITEYFKN